MTESSNGIAAARNFMASAARKHSARRRISSWRRSSRGRHSKSCALNYSMKGAGPVKSITAPRMDGTSSSRPASSSTPWLTAALCSKVPAMSPSAGSGKESSGFCLTVVQAVAHQTQRTSNSAEEFVEPLDGRLGALASTHSLLVETDRQGADLGALARKQQRAKADAQNARASEAMVRGNLASAQAELQRTKEGLAGRATKEAEQAKEPAAQHDVWTAGAGGRRASSSRGWRWLQIRVGSMLAAA